MTEAELRNLLQDCLGLWSVKATIGSADGRIVLRTADVEVSVQAAPAELRPVRWLWQTAERQAASRLPRAAPSVVALLAALRNALGGQGGRALRVGG